MNRTEVERVIEAYLNAHGPAGARHLVEAVTEALRRRGAEVSVTVLERDRAEAQAEEGERGVFSVGTSRSVSQSWSRSVTWGRTRARGTSATDNDGRRDG